MGIAPAPRFDENGANFYERQIAPNIPGNRGPLRFEEGVATDTDVPNDFMRGMAEGAIPAPGAPNHVNSATLFKHADETMRERAHVGSAAWVDAPSVLGEFAHGAMSNAGQNVYEQVKRSGARTERSAPATVRD